ncbi:MAG: hypothetical protein ACRDNI_05530 [Gaiellaceae bacterium]
MSPPDRPLPLGELLAETIRIYGERPLVALGLGAVEAVAFLVADALPVLLGVLLLALSFTATFGAAARLVSGDSFAEAWAQVGLRAPVLLVLTFVVAVPFAIAVGYLLLLIVAVFWIALAGFAVPVTMLERDPSVRGFFDRLAYALYRSIRLARVEYLHAVGVAAALVLVYLLVGNIIGAALVGFADNGRLVAGALVQLVLAPLFFLGLSVLYYEQRARAAVSSRPKAA